ncbi:hypothetical protein MMC21_007758 [Puttea exsequens]|nr:hypothetical protein [Puttea exsequens]
MSFGFSIGDIFAVVQLVKEVHKKIAGYNNSGELKRTALILASSEQKLDLWANTWLVNVSNAVQSETLWGKDGWDDIQKIMTGIRKRTLSFKNFDEPKTSKVVNKSWWRRSVPTKDRRSNSTGLKESPTLLNMALDLEKGIDELWTYSEITFDSLHGLLAQAVVKPATRGIPQEFAAIRYDAVALYSACQRSNVQCNLDINLKGKALEKPPPSLTRARAASLTPMPNLSFHLFVDWPDPRVQLGEVTIESLTWPGRPEGLSNIRSFEEPNLEMLIQASSPGSLPVRVGRKDLSEVGSVFRIPSPAVPWTVQADSENLAQVLYESRTPTRIKRAELLTLSSKLELAYQLAQFTYLFLGTPWLGSLSSKQLRRIKNRDGKEIYALGVQPTPLDDLYLGDSNALSESSQLLRLGLMLMEIALGTPDDSDPNDFAEPYLRASQMLPRVQMAAGMQYYEACSFCIQYRRSTSHYNRPEKYQHSQSVGWDVYLRDLLEEYDSQVLSR